MKIIRKWCFVLKKMKNVIQKNIKALIVICLAISMFVGYNDTEKTKKMGLLFWKCRRYIWKWNTFCSKKISKEKWTYSRWNSRQENIRGNGNIQ